MKRDSPIAVKVISVSENRQIASAMWTASSSTTAVKISQIYARLVRFVAEKYSSTSD